MATTVCSVLTAPIGIKVTNISVDYEGVNHTTVSWGAPCGGVNFYTVYYDDGTGYCSNKTLDASATSHIFKDGQEMQIVTHRNNMTKCSTGRYVLLSFSSLPNAKATNTHLIVTEEVVSLYPTRVSIFVKRRMYR